MLPIMMTMRLVLLAARGNTLARSVIDFGFRAYENPNPTNPLTVTSQITAHQSESEWTNLTKYKRRIGRAITRASNYSDNLCVNICQTITLSFCYHRSL